MKKLAIIVDSFCGKSKESVESINDFYYLPLKTILDGKEYIEGMTETNEKLLEASYKAKDAKTSQPSPASVLDLYNKLSKRYEQIIYLPASSALSGAHDSAKAMSSDYNNIHVINNILVGTSLILRGKEAQEMYNNSNIDKVIKFLEKEGNYYSTYVVPKHNDAFIRGGRLGKTAAAILKKLKTVPIIGFEDNVKLHKKMIKRSGKRAVQWAVDKIIKDYSSELSDDKHEWLICHTTDMENVDLLINILKEYGYTNFVKELTSSVVAIHTGNGALSVGIRKKAV